MAVLVAGGDSREGHLEELPALTGVEWNDPGAVADAYAGALLDAAEG